MKALKFYMIFIFLAAFISCGKDKKYPKSVVVENAAVYYTHLTIDNKPIALEAGVDGYYMYSSYKLDANNIYGFIADLKKADCSNCTNSLKIQINDYTSSSPGGTTLIDSSLSKAFYPFLINDPEPSYAVTFQALQSNIASCNWNIDGGISTGSAVYTRTFPKAGKYNVSLTTTTGNGCTSSISNKVKFGPDFATVSIQANAGPANSISFSCLASGKAPFKYLWDFGNGTSSAKQQETCNYKYQGAYAVNLRVIDAANDTTYTNYNAKTVTDNSSCAANYSISSVTPLASAPAFRKITITWVDSDGTIYSSNNSLQPNDSNFEIVSVSDNEANERGEKTKKLAAKFNCKLFNGSKSITINNAEVVICVAYN